MNWYWEAVTWQPVGCAQGRGRGTTWLQLACDFEAATGIELFSKDQGGAKKELTMSAKARQFALATMQLFRRRGARIHHRRVVSLTNLVPLGAGQLAGLSPPVNLLRHSDVSLFLAAQLAGNPGRNKPSLRWRWMGGRCGKATVPLWKGRHPHEVPAVWNLLPGGDEHFVLEAGPPLRSLTFGQDGEVGEMLSTHPRSLTLGHDGGR